MALTGSSTPTARGGPHGMAARDSIPTPLGPRRRWDPNNTKFDHVLAFFKCQFCGRLQEDPRFWSRVEKQPGDGCWEWTGARNKLGYGVFSVLVAGFRYARRYLAHRYALEFALGRSIESDKRALHACNNPGCVRVGPGHVYEGTPKQNTADMVRRWGRAIHGPDFYRGEENPHAKLTWANVREIRAAKQTRGITQAALARKFGVSPSTVTAVWQGRNWKEETP
jgi:DNA-binding XRE family transcriptional regulator